MNHQNGQLDSVIEIVTPENIAFEYRVAGPFRRLPAYLIDFAIRMAVFVVIGIGATLALAPLGLGSIAVGFALVAWFLLDWFYGGLFETFWNGQTPGKRLLAIRVLTTDGQPINGLQAVLRNILRVVDGLPVIPPSPVPLFLLGLVAVSMNRRFQRLGDLACGTMVVIEEPHWFRGVVRITHPEAMRLASLIPTGFQPSRSLARALAAYVQRREQLTLARREEIARDVAVALRDRFQLPVDTNLDQFLCGLYHRTFITEKYSETEVSASQHGNGRGMAMTAASTMRRAL